MHTYDHHFIRAAVLSAAAAVLLPCCGDGGGAQPEAPASHAFTCSLSSSDGERSSDGSLVSAPSVALTIRGGREADHTVSYSIDGDAMPSLEGLRPDIPRSLDCSGHDASGSHSVSGLARCGGDTCSFACTYAVSGGAAPGTVTWDDPEVTLSVDDIPACGGVVSEGRVTYIQRCRIVRGGAVIDSAATAGGTLVWGDPVGALSLGCTVCAQRTLVGVLRVTVTMNGRSGGAEAQVCQQANVAESMEASFSGASVKVGRETPAEVSVRYTSGATLALEGVSASSGYASLSGGVLRGLRCEGDGTDTSLEVTGGGMTAAVPLRVVPDVTALTYSGRTSGRVGEGSVPGAYTVTASCLTDVSAPAADRDVTADDGLGVRYGSSRRMVLCREGTLIFVQAGTGTVTFTWGGASREVTFTVTE